MLQCFKTGYTLCVVVMVCCVLTVRGKMTSCLPSNSASSAQGASGQPSVPQLPNSFRVKLEVSSEGGSSTEQAEAIVDGDGNRAVLIQMVQGTQTTAYFSYETQEIIQVSGTNCKVVNMSDAVTDSLLLLGQTVTDGLGHVPDGASVLYFGADVVKVYKGTGVMVRGVECDWWQTCVSWSAGASGPRKTMTIKYYFSAKTWSTASMFTQAPIRYDMNGTQVFDNGTTATFHTLYDFFDFRQDTDADTTVYETPEGVECPGRKNTKSIPLPSSRYYHFQKEIIDPTLGVISQAETWYDLDSKLVRVDYRSPEPVPPYDTQHPLTVIHDYNYGVSYVKDLVSDQCNPMPLAMDAIDGRMNVTAYRNNGSYAMHMKDPLSFFFLDSNFTYTGQRFTRDARCDVYISKREDFDYYNNGSRLQAKVEVFFLVDGWRDYTNDGMQKASQRFPLRVQVWITKLGGSVVYNYFDFDTQRPDVSVYDVTDCYDDSASLRFRIRFPGPYKRDMEHMVRLTAQSTLASTMGISPLRVNNLQVEHDTEYLYIVATLLDRTPSLAQFTHVPKAVLEKQGSFSWSEVTRVADCSDLCVNNSDITCQSFQYCPNERGGTCRISRQHVSDGTPTVVQSACDLYSRTVNVRGQPELTAQQAYQKLTQSIRESILYFSVEEDNEEEVDYPAVQTEILFGRLSEVKRPTLTGQFSYRLEWVRPRHNRADVVDIWYDSVSELIRVDQRDTSAGPPYHTPFTVTTISDFSTGISYNIDSHRGNCTVTPIPSKFAFGARPLNWTQVQATGVEVLSLDTPLQLFYLDDTYIFTGQKTVRGILCDVFESKRTDFTVGPGQQHSIFQYFFQSTNWLYDADTSDDITIQQPVQLLITVVENNELFIYNFYDFNDEHTAYDNFNIAPCFTDDQRVNFVLEFNQTYHPYLFSNEWRFKQELQLFLSSQIRVSPLRLQNLQVTYNLDRTYVIATLLGQVSPQLHFVETGKSSPYKAQVMTSENDVVGCASSCYYNQGLVCNSFDLCPDHTCYLSTRHSPDGNVTNSTVVCRHFSRLTEGTEPEPSMDDAFTAIKDLVYKGLLVVSVPIGNGQQTVNFPAVDIRDDILSPTSSSQTGGADLHNKFQLYKTGYQMSGNVQQFSNMAVDECATSCLDQEMFTCDAFTYCYTKGDCLLNSNRPANNQDLVTAIPLCDLYTRLYLDNYQQYPGQVIESVADATQNAVSQEVCARHCSVSTAFTCRSFDFCPATGHCLLHQGHLLDYGTPLHNSSLCSHFSRDYLSDFRLQAQKEVRGHDDAVIDGVTGAACALQCVKETSCQSFEFCQGQCHLSSVLPSTSITVDSDSCDLYSLTASASSADGRTVSPPGKITTPNHVITPSSTSANKPAASRTDSTGRTHPPTTTINTGCPGEQTGSGASNDTGPRVAIGVSMLIGGLLLGVGIVLLVQRLSAEQRDDAAIELVPGTR